MSSKLKSCSVLLSGAFAVSMARPLPFCAAVSLPRTSLSLRADLGARVLAVGLTVEAASLLSGIDVSDEDGKNGCISFFARSSSALTRRDDASLYRASYDVSASSTSSTCSASWSLVPLLLLLDEDVRSETAEFDPSGSSETDVRY